MEWNISLMDESRTYAWIVTQYCYTPLLYL